VTESQLTAQCDSRFFHREDGRTGGAGGSYCLSRSTLPEDCAVGPRRLAMRNPKILASRNSRPPCEKIREPDGVARRLNDAVFLADFGEGFQGAVEVVAFVGGHVAGAQHGALGWDTGRDE